MPFLNEQILMVNDCLLRKALADARFKVGRYEGIAVDVSRRNDAGAIETFPAIMDRDYEAQPVSVDDSYPLIIYHKVNNKTYAIDKKQFGDRFTYMVETSQVKMLVYGKYAKLKLSREQLEALITSNFPDNISAATLAPYKLDNMAITLKGSNLNTTAVFNEEYKGIPLFLSAEDILFSISYTIDTKYRKECISICDCGIAAPALLSNDDLLPLVDDFNAGLIVNN
jgi:hypothetical protein